MTTLSPAVTPFCTRAVNPPTKSTPHSVGHVVQRFGKLDGRCMTVTGQKRPAAGEMASRLLMTGMPYFEPDAVANLDQPAGARGESSDAPCGRGGRRSPRHSLPGLAPE